MGPGAGGAGKSSRWSDALPTDTLFLQPVNMVGVSALRGLLTSQPETASFAEVSALQNQRYRRCLLWLMRLPLMNTA